MENNELNKIPLLITEHQSISSIIDEQIDQEKKNLVTKMSLQEKKQLEIEKLAKELKGDIKGLEKKIQDILDKHHKDYISTFSTFMDTVRKDLKLKLEHMEKIEEEKRKINDVNIIRCERDYFRSEAVSLNKLNKDLTFKIEDMALKMKILSDEVNNLTIKWKDSESVNKQLILELEGNIQSHKELEKEMLLVKDYAKVLQIQNQNSRNKDNNNINNSNEVGEEEEEATNEKLIYSIEKLKMELKRERARNHKILSELNSILIEKNNLENIFIDCVEETRKNIYNRRLKGAINSKVKKLDQKQLDINSKYESFLPEDKKNILEQLVFNDEINKIIHDAMFTKTQKNKIQTQHTKNAINRIDLPSLESSKEDKTPMTTNIIDHTKTSFFKTGRMTMTSFNRVGMNKKLSFPMQFK